MLVELVGLRASVSPIQDKVGGGNVLDAEDVGVERVFSGSKWFGPDALVAFCDDVPVLEVEAADVDAVVSVITDDDAD